METHRSKRNRPEVPSPNTGTKTPRVTRRTLPITTTRALRLFYSSLYRVNLKGERIESTTDKKTEFFLLFNVGAFRPSVIVHAGTTPKIRSGSFLCWD